MRRLFFLTQSIDSADSISAHLHADGISDWNFHILSKDDAGLYQRHLHSANMLHKHDVIHWGQRGLLIGGLVGVIATIGAMLIWGTALNMLTVLSVMAFCLLFGAWLGGFIGFGLENYQIRRFHDAIEQGAYLIMVDVPKHNVEQVTRLMARLHPEAKLAGEDSAWPNPFQGDADLHHTA